MKQWMCMTLQDAICFREGIEEMLDVLADKFGNVGLMRFGRFIQSIPCCSMAAMVVEKKPKSKQEPMFNEEVAEVLRRIK